MVKISKKRVFLSVYFILLATAVTYYAFQSTKAAQFAWEPEQRLDYRLYSADPDFTNATTFQIVDYSPAENLVTATWDARPKESFPFIFTNETVKSLQDAPASNGFPATGMTKYAKKDTSWINKTNVLAPAILQTSYLKYLVNPAHTYYYIIDVATGLVVELGDATDGTILMVLQRWPDQFINWDLIFTIGAALGALVLFASMFRFGTRELKVAPRNTTFDKVRIYFSAFMLATLVTAVAVFIATVVLTAIGENWTLALHFGVPSTSDGVTAFRPLDKAWQSEISFVQAFKWPIFIPITSVLIGIYLCIYPFFEMGFMLKRGSDAPTEIQQKVEHGLLDRAPVPLNFILAAGILFLEFILPTYLIYNLFLRVTPEWESMLQMNLLVVAVAWFTIPALFFLNYYASFGVTAAFWTSVRKGFRSKSSKQNFGNRLVFGLVIIVIFFISYNFLASFGRLISAILNRDYTRMLPAIVLQNPSGGSQALTQIIRFFIGINVWNPDRAEDLWKFDQFITVFPFDLLVFFLTVCVVGLFGFYTKFLSKEPLNRPILVLFASYIIAAIGMNVFINVILRVPNAYPGGFLVDAFTNPENFAYGSEAYWSAYWNHFDTVRVLFFIPYFADQALMFTMLMYNLFGNKELRANIKESVLNYAIQKNRVDILSKYASTNRPSTQRAIAECLYRIVKNSREVPKQTIEVLARVIDSPESDINRVAIKTLRLTIQKADILDTQPAIISALRSNSESNRKAIVQTIVDLGRVAPDKVILLYGAIISADLPPGCEDGLVATLEQLHITNPDLIGKALLPTLKKESSAIRKGVMRIIKRQLTPLRPDFPDLVPKLLAITRLTNEDEVEDAIEILGNVAAFDPAYAKDVLARLEAMQPKASIALMVRIIGATLNIMVAHAPDIDPFLPRIMEFMQDSRVEVRSVLGSALRVVGVAFADSQVFNRVEKVLFKILQDPAENVRVEGAQTLATIGKANPDLLQGDPEFVQMVEIVVKDPVLAVRENLTDMCSYYAKVAPTMVIFYLLLKLLEQKLPLESNRTLFKTLSAVTDAYPQGEPIDLILAPVLAFDRSDDVIRKESAEILYKAVKNHPDIASKAYQFLLPLLNDQNDGVAEVAIRALGFMAMQTYANAAFLKVPLDEQIATLLNQCTLRHGPPLSAALEFVNQVYFKKPELHTKLYPVLINLQDEPHPEVLKHLVLLLADIVCNNRSEYAPRKEGGGAETVWFAQTSFTREFLPALLKIMQVMDPDVKEALAIAVNLVGGAFPEALQEIGAFLKKAITPKQGDTTRLTALSVIGKFALARENFSLVKEISRAARSAKSPDVQYAALATIDTLIDKSPEIKTMNSSPRKCLQTLIRTLLYDAFLKNQTPEIRRAYAGALITIGKKQPEFVEIFPYLRSLVLDGDEEVSRTAIKGIFDILKLYPANIESHAHYFRGFGRSPHVGTRRILDHEIRAVLDITGKLPHVIPAIILLAGDENKEIRRSSFESFLSLVNKHPVEVDYFREILLKFAGDKKPVTRSDAVPAIAAFLKKYPEFVVSGDLLFQTYLELTRDTATEVRRRVLKVMGDLISLIKPEQANMILQVLLRCIREDDRKIKDRAANALRAIGQRFPDRINDIRDSLVPLYRRDHQITLEQLINEFQTELEAQKSK